MDVVNEVEYSPSIFLHSPLDSTQHRAVVNWKTLLMMKMTKPKERWKKKWAKWERAPQWWQQQFTSLLSPVDDDVATTNNSFIVILLISYTFIRLPVIILHCIVSQSKVESLVMIRLITISFMSLEPSSSSLLLLLTERERTREKTRRILFFH